MKTKWPTERDVIGAIERLKREQEIDHLNRAFYTIVGYCSKHTCCGNCRFCDDAGDCFFLHSTAPPCDWKMPKESEDE